MCRDVGSFGSGAGGHGGSFLSVRAAYMINALRVGGAEKLVVTFAQALQMRGDQLTIITLRENQTAVKSEAQAFGARVVEFSNRKVLSPRRLWQVYRFLDAENFDVLHTHLSMANIVGGICGGFAGIPVFTSLHNTTMATEDHPVYRPLETFLLRRASAQVIAVGWETAKAHQSRLGDKEIIVIPNAVPPNPGLTPQQRKALRIELAGDPQRALLIAVSRLEPQKGLHDLLRAFSILRRGHPEARLVIAGKGSLHNALQSDIQELGLTGKARLLGSRSDVPQLLAAADVYVSASHWEGLPVAVLEAMAAGLPVAATAVGDVPRVVVDGMGLLVPPHHPEQLAQALVQLLSNSAQAKAYGERARTHIESNYSMHAWADRLLDLYEKASQQGMNYPKWRAS